MNRPTPTEAHRLIERLRRLVSYPVSTEIDPKGWSWYVAPDAPEVIMETLDALSAALAVEAGARDQEHVRQFSVQDATISILTEQLAEAREAFSKRADSSYIQSLNKFSSTPCLGWEAKVRTGVFGKAEFEAHAEANRLMGRHQAYADARATLSRLEKQEGEA